MHLRSRLVRFRSTSHARCWLAPLTTRALDPTRSMWEGSRSVYSKTSRTSSAFASWSAISPIHSVMLCTLWPLGIPYNAAQPTLPATVSIVARESVSTSPCLLATGMKVPYKVGRVQVKVRAKISGQSFWDIASVQPELKLAASIPPGSFW